jgi:hypothetical protein
MSLGKANGGRKHQQAHGIPFVSVSRGGMLLTRAVSFSVVGTRNRFKIADSRFKIGLFSAFVLES